MERETEKRNIDHGEEVKQLIKQWDDFVTPIREFYGVPRYRPKPKTHDKYGNPVANGNDYYQTK